ncbi:MAG: M48 family metalloprotease [Vicinamibacterales bacterium]
MFVGGGVMGRVFQRAIGIGLLCLSVSSMVWAQAAARPQYTDKEKQRMAEIAKRPEVVAEIDAAWANVQRQDKEFAFHVNSTAGGADWRSNPQWLEVWQKYGRLYDNPILVNYINTLGQKLVPPDSPNLYAFRLVLDPTPTAEALSTGTIYLSTGLVSLLDNEAQLAYVLAHEVAHVERKHMYEQIRSDVLEDKLAVELAASSAKKKAIFGAVMAVGGGALGAAIGGNAGKALTAVSAGAAIVGSTVLFRNKFEPTRWEALHEGEADEFALNAVLNTKYDLREVPKVYTRMAGLISRDKRLGLGFVGDPDRLKQRSAYVEGQIAGPLKAKIDASLNQAGLTGSSAEFAILMAALKRDNGVIAAEYDLMPMAKENFIDAEKLRSNDPRIQYELGKLYAITGRTPEEKQLALTHFQNAIRYDAGRGSFPEPHLQYALQLIAQNNPASQPEIQESLKKYVSLYQRAHGGALPDNMHIIYDYLLMAGDEKWSASPAAVIATRDNEPLPVLNNAPAAAATPAANPSARQTPAARPVSTPRPAATPRP